jgi:hypothetical protein
VLIETNLLRPSRQGKYDAKRFYVRPDRLGDVVAAAAGFAFNAGYGAFADGYGVAVEKDVEGEYAVLKGAGYMLKETSNVKGYARPAKPIELYEFQGCPFCAKGGSSSSSPFPSHHPLAFSPLPCPSPSLLSSSSLLFSSLIFLSPPLPCLFPPSCPSPSHPFPFPPLRFIPSLRFLDFLVLVSAVEGSGSS